MAVRNFQGAYVCLVIAQTLMFSRVLSSQLHGHASSSDDVDHRLIDALGMHVDFDCATASGDCLDESFPEWVASFGNPALAVDAHRYPLDIRALFQNDGESIATVARVGLRGQAFNVVVGIGAVRPLIGMGPDAELKMKSASSCFRGDIAQHLDIFAPLLLTDFDWCGES